MSNDITRIRSMTRMHLETFNVTYAEHFTIEFRDGKYLFSYSERKDGGDAKCATLTEGEFSDFASRLAATDVLSWRRSYTAEDAMLCPQPGSWEIEIDMPDEHIATEGADGRPSIWLEMMQCFGELTDDKGLSGDVRKLARKHEIRAGVDILVPFIPFFDMCEAVGKKYSGQSDKTSDAESQIVKTRDGDQRIYEFVSAFSKSGLMRRDYLRAIRRFDERNNPIRNYDVVIEGADLDDLLAMLTFRIRSDYWNSPARILISDAADGLMSRILKRIDMLSQL